MTQAPTPGPLHDSDCSHDGYEVDTADQPIRCAECGQSLAPTAPVEASGSGWEADAWKWLGQLYPNDAPSDLAYDANEMVDAFLAGSGRSDRMAKALERIADEQQYRSGYCQTDITVEPALTAEEAQTVARDALSTTPAADADRVRSVACLTRYSPLSTGNNKAMMQEDEAGLYVLRKQALAALKSTAAKEGEKS